MTLGAKNMNGTNSTARVSKTIPLKLSNFIHFIGTANTNDLITIQEKYTRFLLEQI